MVEWRDKGKLQQERRRRGQKPGEKGPGVKDSRRTSRKTFKLGGQFSNRIRGSKEAQSLVKACGKKHGRFRGKRLCGGGGGRSKSLTKRKKKHRKYIT